MMPNLRNSALLLVATLLFASAHVASAEEKMSRVISLSDGKMELTAPKSWEKTEPRTRIVEYEFSVAAVEDDPRNGRVTVMGAGGAVETNISRWVTQFVQPDRSSTREHTRITKKSIAGQEVHLVDITGDFRDQPRGPLGPTTMRPKYRLMGAIIVTKGLGQYFVKFYGPRRTVAENEKAFQEMVNSLKVSKK